MALFVDDLDAELARHAAAGRETALYAEMAGGFAFAMVDAVAELGHMIELYPAADTLTEFYAFVAGAAQGWNGADPVRRVPWA